MLHNMRVLVVGEQFFIISKMNKTSCFKSRHFINIYIINRTLHGRLGIRILSSRAESISHSFASLTRERYFQHSKIKFVSPRGHVISSISSICKKVNNQLNVMIRFRKLISKAALIKLYKAFILPHFYYCSSVWHFCGARNTDKIKVLNKRILRFIVTSNLNIITYWTKLIVLLCTINVIYIIC